MRYQLFLNGKVSECEYLITHSLKNFLKCVEISGLKYLQDHLTIMKLPTTNGALLFSSAALYNI